MICAVIACLLALGGAPGECVRDGREGSTLMLDRPAVPPTAKACADEKVRFLTGEIPVPANYRIQRFELVRKERLTAEEPPK